MEQQKRKSYILVIIFFAVVVFVIPPVIAWLVYGPNTFLNIPGKSDVWMGFWASYSGTIMTIVVAIYTQKNSKAINDLQTEFYELNAGINLRLAKVYIVPIIESDNLNRYKVLLCFHNMAKSLIRNMSLCNMAQSSTSDISSSKATIGIKVGSQEDTLEILKEDFGLQEDLAILQFEINLKDTKVKKNFIDSYFYFSQFPFERNSIELCSCIQVAIDEKKPKEKKLHIVMFSEPISEVLDFGGDIADDDFYMNPVKMKIKSYTWEACNTLTETEGTLWKFWKYIREALSEKLFVKPIKQ